LALIDALAADASTDERADAAMALLGDEEDDARVGDGETPDLEIDDALLGEADPALDEGLASGDELLEADGAVEPGAKALAIELPDTFSAELKERFKTLDPETQRTLAQWEQDRNLGVNKKLDEAATIRKTAEAATVAATTQRQQLAQNLELALQLQTQFNPVIVAGMKMTADDWLNLARTNQPEYVAKRAEFEAAMGNVQHAHNQLQTLKQQEQAAAVESHNETVIRELDALATAMPELTDPATKKLDPAKTKLFAVELNTSLRSFGFTDKEIAGVTDHRMLRVVGDAMKWRAGETARKAAAGKRAVPVPARVVKPGTGDAGASSSARQKALLNRANRATSTDAQADAIAAMLD
jgi:hypothetical protein